jgi:hypothetical protein
MPGVVFAGQVGGALLQEIMPVQSPGPPPLVGMQAG